MALALLASPSQAQPEAASEAASTSIIIIVRSTQALYYLARGVDSLSDRVTGWTEYTASGDTRALWRIFVRFAGAMHHSHGLALAPAQEAAPVAQTGDEAMNSILKCCRVLLSCVMHWYALNFKLRLLVLIMTATLASCAVAGCQELNLTSTRT